MKKFLIFLTIFSLLLLEPYLASTRIALQLEDNNKISGTEFVLRFLGEIRYTLASYLWMDIELYLHELGATAESSTPGEQDPKKIGELLALSLLVTKLDPQFVEAYGVSAWRLSNGLGKFNEALQVLQTGVDNNPQSSELYEEMGIIYLHYLKDYSKAIFPLQKAFQYGKIQNDREKDGRLLLHCYLHDGERDKAMQLYEELTSLYPHDTRYLNDIKQVINQYDFEKK